MWTWQPKHTVVPVHLIKEALQVVVAIVEIEVIEEEETPIGEEETRVDMEMVDSQQDHQRNHLTPHSIKERLKVLPARYARNLATLLQRVGSGLRMVVQQIHLDEDQHRPEVETEVRADQAMAHEEEEEEDVPQWL